MILHLIAKHGAGGGAGFAVEFAGAAVTALSIEARMTLCNMAVEFAAYSLVANVIINLDEFVMRE
jgi:3-isopropylmalate/(R)-2-methylmalate dehydratase large subunit